MQYHLLTYEFPPHRGGIARYNAAVAEALGVVCAVHVFPRSAHWTRLLLRSLRQLRKGSGGSVFLTSEVLPLGVMAVVLARAFRGTAVIMCHGLDLGFAARVPRRRWLLRQILRRTDRVIANSAYTSRATVDAGAQLGRVAVVHPPLCVRPDDAARGEQQGEHGGMDRNSRSRISVHPREAHAPALAPRACTVLSVGRLISRKGFDTLIDAVAIARERFPGLELRIIGDGPLRDSLVERARAAGVPLTIDTTADDATLAAAYASCDCFAMLPRELPDGDVEGFGIVYLEAAAFGKPAIGTLTGGVPEAIVDGVTGFLVPPDDPKTAAAAILACCMDPTRAAALGEAGRDRVARVFTFERFAKLIREAVCSAPRASR